MNKKQVFIAIFSISVVLLGFLLVNNFEKNRFKVVSIVPSNGKVLPSNGAVEIVVSHRITNADEIVQQTRIEPSSKFHILVTDEKIVIVPDGSTKLGPISFIIPSIKADNGVINDTKLSFNVEDVDNARNESERKSQEAAIVDADEIITRKFPFLAQLVTYKPNFDIDYQYDGFDLVITVNLHPEKLPSLSDTNALDETYESAYRESQEHIKNTGVDLSQYPVRYTPTFMNEKYGTRQNSITDEDLEFGDGGSPAVLPGN